MTDKRAKKSFKAGDVIMRQGERGGCAYIIEEGQVEILIEKGGDSVQQVGTRSEGSIIGEMALVDDAPRTATVKAVRDCKMLEITRDDFAQRLKGADPIIQMISQVIMTRYRDMLTRADILRESDNYPPPEVIERGYAAKTDAVESIKIANEFRIALESGDIRLHYQPIIDLSKGEVAGFEALMRWPRPDGTWISPGVFIPVAEKSGLIVEASKWALRESCAALGRIQEAARLENPLYVSVNFSSHDFAEPDFVENLLRTVEHSNIMPGQIKLEITERLLIQQPDNAKDALQACRNAGIGIAIDDFGTGYSSLSYLYYFPIETLKIDQSFIRAMFKENRSLELVKSIVGLGKNMDLHIVAEGVEDLGEASLLHNIGCHSAQGYYFAKPMAEEDLIDKLRSWKPFKIPA